MASIDREGTVSAFPRELDRPRGPEFRAHMADLNASLEALRELFGTPDTPQTHAPTWVIRAMKPGGWTFQSGDVILYGTPSAWQDPGKTYRWLMGCLSHDKWACDRVAQIVTRFYMGATRGAQS